MANLAVEDRQKRWYAEAIQRKYCDCHMQSNGWHWEQLEQGVLLPRDELQHLVCLACREQPKMFVLNADMRED